MNMRNLPCVSTLALVALMVSAPAGAQTQPSVSPADPSSSDAKSQVTDIIVTAQRISQSLQEVPASVQPVTGAELLQRKITDVVQLQNAVPSLQAGNNNTLSLRGVGSASFSQNVDSSVGVAVDEVSLGVPLFQNYFGFVDVAQVEVLTGPQGLLFGRNASAGLLNVVTQRPVIGDFSGQVRVEGDYRDSLPGGKWGGIGTAIVNIPVSETAALRLNGLYDYQDAITDTVAIGRNADVHDYRLRVGGKAKFLWQPNDRLTVYLIGDYLRQTGIGGTVGDQSARFRAPGSLTQPFLDLDGITAGPDNVEVGHSVDANFVIKTGGVSANISYELTDNITVSNIAAWRAYHVETLADLDFVSSDVYDLNSRDQRYNQYSNELRVALAPGGFIDGQIGLYYFGSRLRDASAIGAALGGAFGPSDSFVNPVIGADIRSKLNGNSYAAFGQVNLHPTDSLTLLAGARVTHDRLSFDLVQNQQAYPIALGVPNYADSQSTKNTDLSYKFGAQYQITPAVMAYATYSRGYKGPAYNDTANFVGQDLSIGPETVRGVELGLKSILFDRKLRFNIAAFRQIFSDFQVQGFDPVSSSFFTANAAKVLSQGVELNAEFRPVSRLTFSGAATILDSKFKSFANDQCYPGQTTCVGGVTDSSGNRTPSSAKFTATLAATYEAPLSDRAKLILSVDYYHRSAVNSFANADPRTRIGAIDILGANIGIDLDDKVRFEIFCKNCTNKKYPILISNEALDATLLGLNSTNSSWGYNSFRTIGADVTFNF